MKHPSMPKQYFLMLQFFIVLLQPTTAQKTIANTQEVSLQTVGKTSRQFVDLKRMNGRGTGPKLVRTLIWYPVDEKSKRGLAGNVSTDQGKTAAVWKGKHPLILMSHGAGGNAADLEAWGQYLAARGYIVAAVQHRGDSTGEVPLGTLSLADQQMWQRPQDVSAVLDNLLTDPFFISRIDTSKIAAGGFSLGGYTAIALAGARLSLEELQAHSNIDNLPAQIRMSVEQYTALLARDSLLQYSCRHSGDSYKDRRIKGVFALAPAIGQAFTNEGLKDIDVPVHIIAGEIDIIAPKEINAQLYAAGIRNARLTILPGEAGHITRPSAIAAQNWIKVYDLSFYFFEELWKGAHE